MRRKAAAMSTRRVHTCDCGHTRTPRRKATSLGELLHHRPELAYVVPKPLLAALRAGVAG